jgi:hypothetical protein
MRRFIHENTRLRHREKALSEKLIENTKVLNDLYKTPAKYIKPEQWAGIVEALNTIYDAFTTRLQRDIALTPNESHIACLIKLRFSVAKIADMLSIEATSISREKVRIKDKIKKRFGADFDETAGLDKWIQAY